MKTCNLLYRKSYVVTILAALSPFSAVAQTPAKNAYVQHNLVSDIAGNADVTDANLINPWGVTETAASPFWVSNHDKGNTTLYNGSGTITALVVIIPPGAAGGTTGTPTGQVPGNGANWVLSAPNSKPASFIFATEDGTISAWNNGIAAPATAIKMVDNSAAGAVYKGLAVLETGTPMLYAANFHTGNIDVFDGTFAPIAVSGGFTDPNLPAGYAPFNITNIGGKLYVTYAVQDANKKLNVPGAGNGVVNVFDTNGTMLQRISSGGPLNSPWGIAVAPATWGAFGGAVLVGNFGDGKINAFDAKTGNALGTLQDPTGAAIVNTGLWALLFGNGKTGGDTNTLYIAAGITGSDNKTHGLLAGIAPPAQVLSIVNAASGVGTSIAPGEIVTITGFTVGPSPLLALAVPATGTLGTTVTSATAGPTSVSFNGTPAPILYASASATSVIVPYEVAGSTTANVVVTYKSNPTPAFSIPVVATAPGLFTLAETGTGAVVAINSDGTVNGPNNTAARGTPVLLFATGEGQTNPGGQDGLINTGEFIHAPAANVSLSIASSTAIVVYAASTPGNVSGVMLIEAIVPTLPAGVGTGVTGPVPIVLTVGTANSPAGTTLYIR
jgi:uncharacterized protein (TIGR03118 family)